MYTYNPSAGGGDAGRGCELHRWYPFYHCFVCVMYVRNVHTHRGNEKGTKNAWKTSFLSQLAFQQNFQYFRGAKLPILSQRKTFILSRRTSTNLSRKSLL